MRETGAPALDGDGAAEVTGEARDPDAEQEHEQRRGEPRGGAARPPGGTGSRGRGADVIEQDFAERGGEEWRQERRERMKVERSSDLAVKERERGAREPAAGTRHAEKKRGRAERRVENREQERESDETRRDEGAAGHEIYLACPPLAACQISFRSAGQK